MTTLASIDRRYSAPNSIGDRDHAAQVDGAHPEASGEPEPLTAEMQDSRDYLQALPLAQISPPSCNPRTDFNQAELRRLADDILTRGMVQPIVVRQTGTASYQIVAGERRRRAAELAGLSTVAVLVYRDLNDKEAMNIALAENERRQNLNALELAEGYRALIELGVTETEIAEEHGTTQPTVSNTVRLLTLPGKVQELIRAGSLNKSQGMALLRGRSLPDARVTTLALSAVKNNWSSDGLAREIDKATLQLTEQNGTSEATDGDLEAVPGQSHSIEQARHAENVRRRKQATAVLLAELHQTYELGAREGAVLVMLAFRAGENLPIGQRMVGEDAFKMAATRIGDWPTERFDAAMFRNHPDPADSASPVHILVRQDPSKLWKIAVEAFIRTELDAYYTGTGGAVAVWYLRTGIPAYAAPGWQPRRDGTAEARKPARPRRSNRRSSGVGATH